MSSVFLVPKKSNYTLNILFPLCLLFHPSWESIFDKGIFLTTMRVIDLYRIILIMGNTTSNLGHWSNVDNSIDNTQWNWVNSQNAGKRLLDGKLVDTVPMWLGATPVDATTPFYRSTNGTLSTSQSNGVLTSIAIEEKIQAGIVSLQNEYAQVKNTEQSGKFWQSIYENLLNRANPITLPQNSKDNDIIALAVAAEHFPNLWWMKNNTTPPVSSTSNATTNTNPSSTPVNNNTTTTWPSSTPNQKASPSPAIQAKNKTTIDELMKQAYGGANIKDNLNMLAQGTYTSKTTRKVGGEFLEMTFSYPNVLAMINARKTIKRVIGLGELALVDPQAAYDSLTSMRLFKDWWRAEASLRKLVKSRLRKNWVISMPLTQAEYQKIRKDFLTDWLRWLDIDMWWNRNTIIAAASIMDTIVTNYNDSMAMAFKNANDFAKPTATTPQPQTIATNTPTS